MGQEGLGKVSWKRQDARWVFECEDLGKQTQGETSRGSEACITFIDADLGGFLRKELVCMLLHV